MSTQLCMTTTMLDELRQWVTWMLSGTCASCLGIEVWTHQLVIAALFDWLQSRATWMWFGGSRCGPISLWQLGCATGCVARSFGCCVVPVRPAYGSWCGPI